SLALSVGEPVQVGDPVESIGGEQIDMVLTGAVPGVEYEGYADLEDAAGNTTRSPVSIFTVVSEDTQRPSAPQDVIASANGRTVQVAWSAPVDDGGSPILRYEVTVGERTATVAGDVLSTEITEVAVGEHDVTVRAENASGWSEPSEPTSVQVSNGDGETPVPTITVTGSFRPGGAIEVNGTRSEEHTSEL